VPLSKSFLTSVIRNWFCRIGIARKGFKKSTLNQEDGTISTKYNLLINI
jgi:hypothetical protein